MPNKKTTTDTPNSREANASLLSVSEEYEARLKNIRKAYKEICNRMLAVSHEMKLNDIDTFYIIILLRDAITTVLRNNNIDISTLD